MALSSIKGVAAKDKWFVVIQIILFGFKSFYEEKQLQKKFAAYYAYKKRTYRFFPFN